MQPIKAWTVSAVASTSGGPRVIVALDFPSARAAREMVARLDPGLCRLKVGKELFVRAGPDLVGELIRSGFDVFLDLKFHDIPNTVARACAAAADLGVWMLNVHAQGGKKMMVAARESLARSGNDRPLLIAVTILTSLGDADLAETGLAGSAADNVLRLTRLADESGIDGVVCSPREAAILRAVVRPAFLLVTPGIRPAGFSTDDQQRIATPAGAVADGADFLVVGRPVTTADDPMSVLLTINSEIG